MATINKRLGNRIKKLRVKAKLSQEKLASMAKIDLTSVNEIESGNRNPSVKTLYKISLALEVELKSLFEF